MEKLIIQGETVLKGKVRVSGAKNAALPLMAACLLIEDECCLKNVPELTDIKAMAQTLQELGVKLEAKENELKVNAHKLLKDEAPSNLVNMLRASILILGPLLVRKGRANLTLPGGCNIGLRPINLHLKGLSQMGAKIELNNGYIRAKVDSHLVGTNIYLDFPSVGATENILLAASLAKGTTIIQNASCTPEVVDVCNFLERAGVKIKGKGTRTLVIKGASSLSPVSHFIISDRIEAGTFMMAAGITGGEIILKDVDHKHLKAPISKLESMGMSIERVDRKIKVKGSFPLKPVKVKTLPHPGFPTDLQPQLTSLSCLAEGESEIVETIFESRFSHISELKKMGAKIKQQGEKIKVAGVPTLHGESLVASDIRGGAALILAGLAARGETEILNPHYIDRGYEKFEEKLSSLGANIKREEAVK